MTEAAVRGRLCINLVGELSFRSERYTGTFELDGSTPFHGHCGWLAAQPRNL